MLEREMQRSRSKSLEVRQTSTDKTKAETLLEKIQRVKNKRLKSDLPIEVISDDES
jgi:hypothetical protein